MVSIMTDFAPWRESSSSRAPISRASTGKSSINQPMKLDHVTSKIKYLKKSKKFMKSYEPSTFSNNNSRTNTAEPKNERNRRSSSLPSSAHSMEKEFSYENRGSSPNLSSIDSDECPLLQPHVARDALKTGILNLSNCRLMTVPKIVWSINDPGCEEFMKFFVSNRPISLNDISEDEDDTYDIIRLYNLDLSWNMLKKIPSDIEKLYGLTILDLRNNNLESIPPEIGTLSNLVLLNLNYNRLSSVPSEIRGLRKIRLFAAAGNYFTKIPDGISSFEVMDELILTGNKISNIPYFLVNMNQIRMLDLQNNRITKLPLEFAFMTRLKDLKLSHNPLTEPLDYLGKIFNDMHFLENISLQNNNLRKMPTLKNCMSLLTINLMNNFIDHIEDDDLKNIPHIKKIELRNNRLESLPSEFVNLIELEYLDVRDNLLNNIPSLIGTIPKLSSIRICGNPLKNINREFHQLGSENPEDENNYEDFLRYLRNKIKRAELKKIPEKGRVPTAQILESKVVLQVDRRKISMNLSKHIDLSNQGIMSFPDNSLEWALQHGVRSVDLNSNNFSVVPEKLLRILVFLYELSMSDNHLKMIPGFLSRGTNLQVLNFSRNNIMSFDVDMGVTLLRTLNLGFNKFKEIPSTLFRISTLETLIMNDNLIESINAEGLIKLKRLRNIDFSNNMIRFVPPKLGDLMQIQSLNIRGNPFRVPRADVLDQGTESILSFLRLSQEQDLD